MSPSIAPRGVKRKLAKSTTSKPLEPEPVTPETPAIDLAGLFMPGGYQGPRLREADHPWQNRRRIRKALRERTPRESHSSFGVTAGRPDPITLLEASNVGRQPDLIPLRMGRMAASPFTFLRGAACVMAWDLSRTPQSGIRAIIDGDAHINNFGLYGTPERKVVFDMNDFDETTIGPWEWDLKRLVASVNVAARANGMGKADRAAAVLSAVSGYRSNIGRLESLGVLDTWYEHVYPDPENTALKRDPKARAIVLKTIAKAMATTNAALLKKIGRPSPGGGWSLIEDPPILTRVDDQTAEKVIRGLEEYAPLLPLEGTLCSTAITSWRFATGWLEWVV